LTKTWKARLVEALGEAVALDCSLAPRVAFRIGGPADAFVRPTKAAELQWILTLAREHELPVTVLGTGSNVLVSDLGIRGITLRLQGELADVHIGSARQANNGRPEGDLSTVLDPGLPAGSARQANNGRPEGAEIEVGAGALNAPLVSLALNLKLVGIEFLATIPGTFGGALIMNAGAHGGEIGCFVELVTLIDRDLQLVTRSRDQCGFAYRSSGFAPGEILTGARLRVPKGDPEQARSHLAEMRSARKRTQPNDHPNAGSIFKNPPGDYAGRMIEACGLKGLVRGGALISPVHANFIVNTGKASARDVIELADEARRRVKDRFGVDLEWEVRRVGEWPARHGVS
jgi:UDP-N-acetylmuramate dehydrogenase